MDGGPERGGGHQADGQDAAGGGGLGEQEHGGAVVSVFVPCESIARDCNLLVSPTDRPNFTKSNPTRPQVAIIKAGAPVRMLEESALAALAAQIEKEAEEAKSKTAGEGKESS